MLYNPTKTNNEQIDDVPLLAPIIQNGGKKDEIIAKADSGASQHYFRPEDSVCLRRIHTDIGPPVNPSGIV